MRVRCNLRTHRAVANALASLEHANLTMMALRTRATVSSSFAFCSKSVDSHQVMRSSNYRTMLLSHDTGFQSGKASGSPQIAVWGKKSAGFLSSFQLVDGPQAYLQHGASASSSESGRRVEGKMPAARSLGTGGDDAAANPAGTSLLVVSFYKFANLPDCEQMRAPLKEICEANRVSGSIILAHEGINGSICGTRVAVETVMSSIQSDERLSNLRCTEAPAGPDDEILHHGHTHKSPLGAGIDAPFRWDHVRVKLKKEVVPLGVPGVDPAKKVGKYVRPKEWNELISDPNTMVVDVRNAYEIRIGKFKGAVDPQTDSFRDFPAWANQHLSSGSQEVCKGDHGELQAESQALLNEEANINVMNQSSNPQRIAMYCTGGIRCEKATSFLINQGFQEVYHLEGGILKYLEEMPPGESLWEGECFVFDKRVSVGHGLKQGSYRLCYACKKPIDDTDATSPLWEEGVSCPHCFYTKSDAEKSRARARHEQFLTWGVIGGPNNGQRTPSPSKMRSREYPIRDQYFSPKSI